MAEKKIGGRVFRCAPMLATDAIRLQVRLVKFLGGAVERLPEIVQGASKGATDAQRAQANAKAIGLLVDLIGKSDPDDVARLMSDIVALSQIRRDSGDYHDADIDGDFVGRPGDMFEVVIWVLQEQIGPFFSGLQAIGGQGSKAKV